MGRRSWTKPLKEAQFDPKAILNCVFAFSRQQNYCGFNKHDALNSPFLNGLFGWSRPTRLLATQVVARAPINLRPWLGVPKTRNPKGLGLFAQAHLDAFVAGMGQSHLGEAEHLLDLLLSSPSQGFKGLSWGYPYPWQDVGFFAPRHLPNRVVTCWIGFAFAEAAKITGIVRYREALPQIAQFLLEEPNILESSAEMLCYSYVPDPKVTWAVMDVSALMGAFLAEADAVLGTQQWTQTSQRLMRWVADKQTDYGAWFYTHPAKDSHITHDNYHTGIILDCFHRYEVAMGDEQFHGVWSRGLQYYAKALFQSNGAPRWMNNKRYPYDIHGAASGILCFSRAATVDKSWIEMADRILDWTLENMDSGKGWFYYQKGPFWTKRYCLLRWCNAWMAKALAYHLNRT